MAERFLTAIFLVLFSLPWALCLHCTDEDDQGRGPPTSRAGPSGEGPQVVKQMGGQPALDGESRLKVGQTIPSFKAVTIDDSPVSSEGFRGKNVLFIFMSTTCTACRAELRFLDERLRPSPKQLVVVVVGRENTKAELAAFKQAQHLSFLFVPDPERDLYERFASARVPRTYLFDREGALVHQTRDFTQEQGEELLRRIAALQER